MDNTDVANFLINVNKNGLSDKKTIGVVVSGGFDSSLLWYIVNEFTGTDQKVIPFTVPKVDGALTYATRMLEWYSKLKNTKRLHPIVINQEGVDWNRNDYQGDEVAQQLLNGIKEIVDNNMADVVFTGVNDYPPHYKTLCSYHTPAPRKKVSESDYVHNGVPINEIIKQPFADYTKDFLVRLAWELGILNDVAEFSHSCVEQIRGRCNECFWCKERSWAFQEAGLSDIGKE
tara:strand:- start:753 stop:1445 length:693 start_codon:yes stop_codon:yes gene_type:complete